MGEVEQTSQNQELLQLSAEDLVDKILADEWFSNDTEKAEYQVLIQKLSEEHDGVIDITQAGKHSLIPKVIEGVFDGVIMPDFAMYSKYNGETYYDGTLNSGEDILINKKGEYYISGDFSSQKQKLGRKGGSTSPKVKMTIEDKTKVWVTPVLPTEKAYVETSVKPRGQNDTSHGMVPIQDDPFPGVAPAPDSSPFPKEKPNTNGVDSIPLPRAKPLKTPKIQEQAPVVLQAETVDTVQEIPFTLKNKVNISGDNQAILAKEYGKTTLMLSDLIARAQDYISRGAPNVLPQKGVKYTDTQKADSIALQGLTSFASSQVSADKMGDLDAFFGGKSGTAMGESIGENISSPNPQQITKLLAQLNSATGITFYSFDLEEPIKESSSLPPEKVLIDNESVDVNVETTVVSNRLKLDAEDRKILETQFGDLKTISTTQIIDFITSLPDEFLLLPGSNDKNNVITSFICQILSASYIGEAVNIGKIDAKIGPKSKKGFSLFSEKYLNLESPVGPNDYEGLFFINQRKAIVRFLSSNKDTTFKLNSSQKPQPSEYVSGLLTKYEKHDINKTIRDVDALDEGFRERVKKWVADCELEGVHLIITETLRTQARQEFLYSKGRSLPGNKVTWTKNSNHKLGRAVDIAFDTRNHDEAYPGYKSPLWDTISKLAEENGMDWGYDLWGTDGAHFQDKGLI